MDIKDVSGYMKRLGRSTSPEAKTIKAELDHAAQDLAAERNAAQQEGIPVSPSQLATTPPLVSQNAAPIYQKVKLALANVIGIEKSLTAPAASNSNPQGFTTGQWHVALVDNPMGPRILYSSSDLAAARQQMARRGEAMRLIHLAARKPACDFQRNWSLGPMVLFPEFSTMRGSARLLKSESYLLARDGRWREAVERLSDGFRIAQHAAADPILIGYLVAVAIDAITLSGMEDLLVMAGPNAEVADLARTVAANRPRLDLAHALGGEAALATVSYKMLRQGKPQDFENLIGLNGGSRDATGLPGDFSEDEHRFFGRLLDATEAAHLKMLRNLVHASAQPYPARIAAMKAQDPPDQDEKNPDPDPVHNLLSMFSPTFGNSAVGAARAEARASTVIAGARLLAYRARHSAYPEALGEAMPKVPMDPFDGKPIRYRREGSGFVVYSIGEDGKFDGGQPGMKKEGRQTYLRYPPPAPQPLKRD